MRLNNQLSFTFFYHQNMERNKSKKLKEKKYLERFIRLNVYSIERNNRSCHRIKPKEIHEIFRVMQVVMMDN